MACTTVAITSRWVNVCVLVIKRVTPLAVGLLFLVACHSLGIITQSRGYTRHDCGRFLIVSTTYDDENASGVVVRVGGGSGLRSDYSAGRSRRNLRCGRGSRRLVAGVLMSERRRRDAAWGRQVRSYVMHPHQLVKDHRTGHVEHDVDRVLDGELDGFVMSYLRDRKRRAERNR